MRTIDLTGKKVGKLTVIERAGRNKFKQLLWECLCECGNKTLVVAARLNSGHTSSCGCLWEESVRKAVTTHGQSSRAALTPEYRCWSHIKSRCLNPKVKEYKNYGGRGIRICPRWAGENGFENFFEDMGVRPSPIHSIDMFPDKNGHYELANCRWATPEQQARNKRSSKITEAQALEIRKSKLGSPTLGKMYGVSSTNIQNIKKRIIFKKMYGEPILVNRGIM